MERLSIFDIFKIGVGPSSSHTLGPWKAALKFREAIRTMDPGRIEVVLYGSLAKTGKGHASDIAIVLGLAGHDPITVDTKRLAEYYTAIKTDREIVIGGVPVPFDVQRDLTFNKTEQPPHPNTMVFRANLNSGELMEKTWFSVGGGFIVEEGVELTDETEAGDLPYSITSGRDLIRHAEDNQLPVDEIIWQNELYFNQPEDIRKGILNIYRTMLETVYRGCNANGILPGGLNVRRRAKTLYKRLLPEARYSNFDEWKANIKSTGRDFGNINQWVSCFALAVNEENASMGRIVTSPTNGAAGVIPAVLLYHNCFCDSLGESDIIKFMLISGQIGCIFKMQATISAAMGGCQAEIGVSSAMAAAGLTALHGGSPRQVLMAAEIAMEHHLGLTCDPIAGLVQIPCIERNTMGAIKAITASNLALTGDPSHAIVDFDTVVKTMWETAQDMHHKYKETADGGLAIALPVVIPEC